MNIIEGLVRSRKEKKGDGGGVSMRRERQFNGFRFRRALRRKLQGYKGTVNNFRTYKRMQI